MFRLLIFFVFAAVSDVCFAQRYCSTRVISAVPTATYTIAPIKPLPSPKNRVDNIEMISMAKALAKLQNLEKESISECFTSEIITKLIDALVASSTQKMQGECENGGNFLNVALGDTDILGVSV